MERKPQLYQPADAIIGTETSDWQHIPQLIAHSINESHDTPKEIMLDAVGERAVNLRPESLS